MDGDRFEALLRHTQKVGKMKTALLVLMFLMQSQISAAADNMCEKDFGLDVAYCSQAFDRLLSPKLRGDYQKGCVSQAKIDKEACQSGTSNCLALCQVTYDSSAATCEQTYANNFPQCSTNQACQDIVTAQRAACISATADALTACTVSCGI